MKVLAVSTSRELSGAVTIHGAKNSVLPILAGCCACRGFHRLNNCPHITDVDTACRILRVLGADVRWDGNAILADTRSLSGCCIPQTLSGAMRASILFAGALLSSCKEAELSGPGGCCIGKRPIDLHLSGFRAMGAEVTDADGRLLCRGEKLHPCRIALRYPSVGATENLMLASLRTEGVTTICNAAREPEIPELARFLNGCGADISGAGTDTIAVRGKASFHDSEFTLSPDRMETVTYLCAGAACGGTLLLQNGELGGISPVAQVLREGGCTLAPSHHGIVLQRNNPLVMCSPFATAPYPGFPTDALPLTTAAFLRAKGETVMEECVFESRFRFCRELRKLGAQMETAENRLHLRGTQQLTAADMTACDLRAGAALVIAAMQSQGKSRIFGMEHILRGYEALEKQLQNLGADVKTVDISGSL